MATADRLPSLTGLRFGAAFLVFGLHIVGIALFAPGPGRAVMGYVFGAGQTAVSFFFVLSGFVLTWSSRPDDTATRFWRRRLARIYPSHLATMIVAAAWFVAIGYGTRAPTLLANAFLVQAWSASPDVYYSLNGVSWSLSCVAFFY